LSEATKFEATKFCVTVRAEDAATASRRIQALQRILLEEGPPADIERVRTSDETLDGGATLAIVLASPVLLELARCLRMFLERYHSSAISIADERGSIIADNVSAATVSDLINEWSVGRHAP
jgi:hypothetical protein